MGLSFLNTALLWSSLLVAAPILIHLLNKRRFRIMEWAAMEFLLEANLKNRRRVRIENLILLALRCLLIALVVFLVSRPFLSGSAALPFARALEKTGRTIILDDSMSMGHRPGDRSSFEAAKEGLLAHLATIGKERSNDPVTILKASTPDSPLLAEGYITDAKRAELEPAIQGLEPTDGVLDLARTLRAAREAIPEETESMRRVVTIITDLRRVDFFDGAGAPDAALLDAFGAFEGLPVEFLFADVGHPSDANVAVTGIESVDAHVIAGIRTRLQAEVTNFGSASAEDVSIAFTVGAGAPPPTPIGRLSPGETKVVPFPFAFPAAGSTVVRAEVGPDALAADNARLLSLEVRSSIEVLAVDGEPSPDSGDDEVFYVVQALDPLGDTSSGVRVRAIPERLLAEEKLDDVDVLILANVYAVPETTARRLELFVEGGGGLLVFAGDQVDSNLYNRHLHKGGEGLLPVSLGDIREEDLRFSGDGLSHPAFRIFEGPNNPFLRKVIVRQTIEPSAKPTGEARVIVKYDDPAGTPAVVEKAFGKGRVILFLTAADREWSEWPTDPSYLIALQEVVQYVARTPGTERNLRPGEPIEMALDPTKAEPDAELRRPGYPEVEPARLTASPRADGSLWFDWSSTRRAGEYHVILRTRDGGEADEAFVVNPASREGDLRRVDPAEVQTLLEGEEVAFVDDLATVGSGKSGGGVEIWKLLGSLFAILLLVELVLAWKFGHHDG